MSKIKTVGSIKEFMSGDWKNPQNMDDTLLTAKVLALSGGATALIIPKAALAAGQIAGQAVEVVATVDGTFGNVHEAIMKAFDAGVVLVIIFAGAAWGLGHRTKAIEIIMGVCCGYILARHATDIRDFLKGI